MREFNKVNPSLWGSQKFKKLSHQDKLLYLYFLTCPHSNSAGFFWCPLGYIISDFKISEEDLRKGIERVCDTLLIGYDFDEEMVFLNEWFRFNPPSNPNHAKKIFNDIKGLSECSLKGECLQHFMDCLIKKAWDFPDGLEEILKGYGKGIERVSPPDSDSDSDQTQTETNAVVIVEERKELYVKVCNEIRKLTDNEDNPNWFGITHRVQLWLENGFDPERDIYPTIKRIISSGKKPATIKYFEKAIADAYASNTAPIQKGNPNNGRSGKQKYTADDALRETLEDIKQGRL